MLVNTGQLLNIKDILTYIFTPNCESSSLGKPKHIVNKENEILHMSYTSLGYDMVSRYVHKDKVSYTYKTYYGDWSGLVKFLKKNGVKDSKVIAELHLELTRKGMDEIR